MSHVFSFSGTVAEEYLIKSGFLKKLCPPQVTPVVWFRMVCKRNYWKKIEKKNIS